MQLFWSFWFHTYLVLSNPNAFAVILHHHNVPSVCLPRGPLKHGARSGRTALRTALTARMTEKKTMRGQYTVLFNLALLCAEKWMILVTVWCMTAASLLRTNNLVWGGERWLRVTFIHSACSLSLISKVNHCFIKGTPLLSPTCVWINDIVIS